ncbi:MULTISPECIES: formate/nitrite transporter family protein [Uliginosibacterium]|uniref:Formate/nitrite transporter family protein n=1 Tax=Uliginosibacterium aquaticum TaxID=2731212 RepID=A0ABX2IED3_9RHOO|nr:MULTISPECIES: formate/nitrite transporter family protein [Uliginosibacterium]MDO6385235.1 formate/nitrite transporter family protein [Uliginosibacterium sp. 31-12]NSL55021.1 formate/nitrite transporter family protein [Uliginosibacterium aquaticum]
MIDRPLVEKSAASGQRKMSLLERDPARYLMRAVLAGMYLSIVVFVYWALSHNLHGSPFGKVIASAFFGVGLSIIVFTNAELFTSNNMYLAVSSAEGRTTWFQSSVLWTVCYAGNLVGALIVAGLLYGAGTLAELPADHALYVGAAHKVHQGALAIFIKGILANWVVCLAVRLALSMKEDIAKISIMILVVFIFLYLSFEHSIANMGTFSMSLLGNGSIDLRDALYNLVFSTAGNIVGGAVFVGLPFRYLNPEEARPGA